MKNYSMKLQLKRNAHFFCIVLYPINAYVYLSLNSNAFGKIKADNISKVVVFEKLAVNVK